jgi:hypothetical protein
MYLFCVFGDQGRDLRTLFLQKAFQALIGPCRGGRRLPRPPPSETSHQPGPTQHRLPSSETHPPSLVRDEPPPKTPPPPSTSSLPRRQMLPLGRTVPPGNIPRLRRRLPLLLFAPKINASPWPTEPRGTPPRLRRRLTPPLCHGWHVEPLSFP